MRVQNNFNQQSFQARAWFKPPAIPVNLRKLMTYKPREAVNLANLDLTTHIDPGSIVENLRIAAQRGEIKRSKKIIVPQAPYTEAKVFELNGDTVILYSNSAEPVTLQNPKSRVDIEHGADGNQGITQIFHSKYFPRAKDLAFDSLARALNELPELKPTKPVSD